MKVQRVCWIPAVAILALAMTRIEAQAQYPSGPAMANPTPVYAGRPVAYPMVPAATAYQPGWGYVVPSMYSQPAPFPMPAEASPAYPPEPVPESDGSGFTAETDQDLYYNAFEGRGHRFGRHPVARGAVSLLGLLAPYSEGGCCAPHWFDVHIEALFLDLDNNAPHVVFSQDAGGVDRITTGDLGYGNEPGMRVTGTWQTGPGSNLEFTYLGVFDFHNRTSTTGIEDLNSVFSDFTNLNPPDGLEQFDLANFHEVLLANDFDSFELNYRRRWRGPTCLFQGSWLAGVRYVRLKETLRFHSYAKRDTDGDFLSDTGGDGYYNLDAVNYMTGGQLGGDLWLCVLPGLNLGLELKGAVLGNNAKQHTNMYSSDPFDGDLTDFDGIVDPETVSNDKISFLGEVNLMVNYRLNANWTVRAGYSMVFVEGVALAVDNFNPVTDTLYGVGARQASAFLADGGSLFYDGFTFGAEWMW